MKIENESSLFLLYKKTLIDIDRLYIGDIYG